MFSVSPTLDGPEPNAGQRAASVYINPLAQQEDFPVVRPRRVKHYTVDPPHCVWAIVAFKSTIHSTQLSNGDVLPLAPAFESVQTIANWPGSVCANLA